VLDWNNVSAAGKTLLLNTLAFATGAGPKQLPALSLAREGKDIVITYSDGILQSADAITGPWNNEAGASPLKVTPTAAAKFYRVRGN